MRRGSPAILARIVRCLRTIWRSRNRAASWRTRSFPARWHSSARLRVSKYPNLIFPGYCHSRKVRRTRRSKCIRWFRSSTWMPIMHQNVESEISFWTKNTKSTSVRREAKKWVRKPNSSLQISNSTPSSWSRWTSSRKYRMMTTSWKTKPKYKSNALSDSEWI